MGFSFAALLAFTGAGGPDRSGPPEPGPIPEFRVPVPERFALSNGIPVLYARETRAPLTDLVVAFRSGASSDPDGHPGVADWTASMLSEGAGGRSALDFADAVDVLGARLRARARWEDSVVSLHVPTARLGDALALMADMILRPDFPPAEWERLVKDRRTAFLEMRDDPRELARLARARASFGPAHRYGLPLEGTPSSLAGTTPAELRAYHRRCYRPDNTFIVVTGDVEREAIRPLLDRAFGRWKAAESAPPPAPAPGRAAAIEERDVVLVDKPAAAQSVLVATGAAPDDLRPLSPPDDVLSTLLGGSFTSRLNRNLREEHGYTYGAFSSLDLRDYGNSFYAMASVATDVTAPALHEMLKELDGIQSPPSSGETVQARRYLALGFPARFETGSDVADFWAWATLRGLSIEQVSGYPAAVEAVDSAAVHAAALRDIHPGRLRIVIVGDRGKIEPGVKALGIGPIQAWTVDQLLGPATSTR